MVSFYSTVRRNAGLHFAVASHRRLQHIHDALPVYLEGDGYVGRVIKTHGPVASVFDAFGVCWERFSDDTYGITPFFLELDCCG